MKIDHGKILQRQEISDYLFVDAPGNYQNASVLTQVLSADSVSLCVSFSASRPGSEGACRPLPKQVKTNISTHKIGPISNNISYTTKYIINKGTFKKKWAVVACCQH